MTWILLLLLFYLLIGAALVARVFSGDSVEAPRGELLLLVVLWPLAVPFFRVWLNTRRMIRALEELDDRSD